MPQESNFNSRFTSPSKNLRGLKALVNNSSENGCTEEIINDYELALRKAEEAASRRYQATQWLRQMDQGASEALFKEPSEEEFCLSLRNGLILCNVLNKVNPGAVSKVVENPIIPVQSLEGPAQSAIQYFENMRNFLDAVKNMKLLTFEASDLEKGGSSSKVVDCILCLKGYFEWKQAGGIGVWRYGGTVRITNFPKESPSSSMLGSESNDESLDESESLQYEQLLEFLHFSNELLDEESRIANVLTFLFDRFGIGLLQAYLQEIDELEGFPMNAMVIDTLLSKVVKDFSTLLVSQGTQLELFLKKVLKEGIGSLSKSQFIEIISRYLKQRTSLVSSDLSTFCVCAGKREAVREIVAHSPVHAQIIDIHQNQLQELKSSFLEMRHGVYQAHSKWEEDLRTLVLHVKNLEVASSSYQKVLEENRHLHNQVQDLKGTIRVYCRVRPFLRGQSNGQQSTVDYIGENGNIMIVNPLKQGKDTRRIFTFNKVFGTNVTQEQIYEDTQPLVRSVLDGYNVCIFAYGQTGSGKTYTMSGPDLTTEDTWGVNYRALRDLFQISKERIRIVRYEVSVQMIEIYNEQVRDLLVSDGSTRRLDIRNNSQLNGLNVPDACLVPVTCTRDVLDLMKIGQKNRTVGATALNERSSRSHSVLTVHVQGKELVSGTILRGCLHLVDLAGSERVEKSEALGERLKEAQHINRSLSALGDVISALAQKSPHIPYRNSKLTQVLQDSLGGHAKTLMFVHVNPEVNAFGETISTLKFAERVSCIELGAAKSNKETAEIRELKDEVSNLKLALERKEAELEQYKSGSAMRAAMDSQKARAVSPFRLPRYGLNNTNSRPENPPQVSFDEPKISEPRSCSSGKQRRPRFPFGGSEKETLPKMTLLPKERSLSPSPPIRRSISTERGSSIKSCLRPENSTENQQQPPISRAPFPARVQVNKSTAAMPTISPSSSLADNNNNNNNITEALHSLSLQKLSSKKFQQDHEAEEQFKQALNIRQGGIRKARVEPNKAKMIKQQQHSQVAARLKKSEAVVVTTTTTTLLSDLHIGEKIAALGFSDQPESNQRNVFVDSSSPAQVGSDYSKKTLKNFSRNSQNHEPPRQVATMEAILAGKLENKSPAGAIRSSSNSNVTMPDSRRSRSTPRGKFFALP